MDKKTREVSQSLQVIAQLVDKVLEDVAGERVAFTLMVYTPGRASYIGTAPREVAIAEMRTLANHLEAGMPDVPAHEVQ